MRNKSIHFNLDPADPKVLDPNYLSEVKFNLEVKSQQLEEIDRHLTTLANSQHLQQQEWLQQNLSQIEEMVDEFVDQAIESFDSMVLDEELAILGAQFSQKLRSVVDQAQSLLESLEKGI